jgi:hypothetical protein
MKKAKYLSITRILILVYLANISTCAVIQILPELSNLFNGLGSSKNQGSINSNLLSIIKPI